MSNKPKRMPNLAYLDKILSYDPVTGLFKRLDTGRVCGIPAHPDSNTYVVITIGGAGYQASRLAWYLYHRREPREGYHIDHFDGKRNNNRIENLRELNPAQNSKSGAHGGKIRFYRDGYVE